MMNKKQKQFNRYRPLDGGSYCITCNTNLVYIIKYILIFIMMLIVVYKMSILLLNIALNIQGVILYYTHI